MKTDAPNHLSASEIARHAYQIWEAQGRPEGLEQEHWYQAERELTAQTATTRARRPSTGGSGKMGLENVDSPAGGTPVSTRRRRA